MTLRSRSVAYEGRGGQQLLLPRRPFCPGRDCQPCSCARCAARRTKRIDTTPDLIGRTFSPAAIQPALFPSPRRSARS